jgi:catechol 2,3-dioxygenase-like lactoylglutathione lyase family enzyme
MTGRPGEPTKARPVASFRTAVDLSTRTSLDLNRADAVVLANDYVRAMAVKRIVAYAGGQELAASREFYVEVLGLQVSMEEPVLDLQSPDQPAAEVIIGAQEMQDASPSFGIDVGEPAAVDAAHAEALSRGLRVVYPLTDEPWGVRRFFVEDPGGTVVNVLAHIR